MKNIHILPTDKQSKLYYWEGKLRLGDLTTAPKNLGISNQNIYITSDEEIKEGDWFLDDNNQISHSYRLSHVKFANPKKIILTTDQDLIKDGVQAIDDDFLEWFVKNPKSENVYVYKEYKQVNQNNPVTRGSTALGFSHYEVQSLDLSAPIETNEKEIVTNLPNSDDFFKQETLEEADEIITTTKFSWEEDKKMYSEEEVLEQLNLLYGMKNSLVDTFTDENDYITMKWFEQFKKK